jgi:hypothetical protein
VFKSNTGNLVISETNLPDVVEGGRVAFADFNDTATDDRTLAPLGKTQRTNAALTDTTVHTAGGSALRFEPLSAAVPFTWSFDVPTGVIQGLTMTVAVWCKLGSATYYGTPGSYQLPRLSVLYDGVTTAYDEHAASTDWELLSVTFAPTTTTGKITVTLSGMTDAVTADSYIYWDDMAVLYPAGYKLDLGSLDVWDNGLPVTPPIATVASAADVLAVQSSTLTGAGTFGKAVMDLYDAMQPAAEAALAAYDAATATEVAEDGWSYP